MLGGLKPVNPGLDSYSIAPPSDALVQQELAALRGTPAAELDAIRRKTSEAVRNHLDTIRDNLDVPDVVARISTIVTGLNARIEAIDMLRRAAAAPTAPADRQTPTEVFVSEPVLFNPTKVWAPTGDDSKTDRTALIIGGLAVAALFLLLARKA